MAAVCGRLQGVRWSAMLTILLGLLMIVCEADSRCDSLCSYQSKKEQCERCKLQIPLRFGKRSSPDPIMELVEDLGWSVDDDDDVRRESSRDGDRFTTQFLRYLVSKSATPQRHHQRRRADNDILGLTNDVRDEEVVGDNENSVVAEWPSDSLSLLIRRKKRSPLRLAAEEASSLRSSWNRRLTRSHGSKKHVSGPLRKSLIQSRGDRIGSSQ